MTTEPRGAGRGRAQLSRQLNRAGHGLLVVFGVTAVCSALPLRLGQPAWQIQISAALINNGAIALVGLLLIALAGWLSPEDRALQRRNRLVRRLAAGAVAGYLLLVPLQAVALWQGVQDAGRLVSRQRQVAENRLAQVEAAVAAASSPTDLQSRLQRIPGAPPLDRSQLNEPLEVIRQRFGLALEQARARIRGSLAAPGPAQVQQLTLESIRIGLSSLALAFAFAASARLRDKGGSLLDDWQEALGRRRRQSR